MEWNTLDGSQLDVVENLDRCGSVDELDDLYTSTQASQASQDGTQQKRRPKQTNVKEWPTSLAILFVQGCLEYCKSIDKHELNIHDKDIDWEVLIGMVKWPETPKTKEVCMKKAKDIRHQWISPGGSLAEVIRHILRQAPPIFGREGCKSSVSSKQEQSCKRSSTHSDEFEQSQPIAKRSKLADIIPILENVLEETTKDLEIAHQHLHHLNLQLEQLMGEIIFTEKQVAEKTMEQKNAEFILQMPIFSSTIIKNTSLES